MELSLNADGTM